MPAVSTNRPSPASKPASILLLIVALAVFSSVWFAGYRWADGSGAVPPPNGSFDAWYAAVHRVGLAEIGEDSHLVAVPPEMPLRWCAAVSPNQESAFLDAYDLMRATAEGRELYDLLQREGICVTAENLPYNAGYIQIVWSPELGWSGSEIVIDSESIDQLYPDTLAAILVHEAEHSRRAIEGTACYFADACTDLENGIQLEEEIAAHGAESRWWIEIYGEDGKSRAFRTDRSENSLARVYLEGEDAFAAFIAEFRSSEQEGEGI